MKSKMKSAFAVIAVALMVMVALVPMAGLLSNDSAAYSGDAVAIPTISGDDEITVTVNAIVYAPNGTNNIAGAKVIVTGSGISESGITGTTGVAIKVTFFGQPQDLTVSVDTTTEKFGNNVNPAYGLNFSTFEFKQVAEDGTTLTAKFVAGTVRLSGTVAYANTAAMAYKTPVTVTLYERSGTAAPYDYTPTSYSATSNVDGTFAIYVPANLAFTVEGATAFVLGASINNVMDYSNAIAKIEKADINNIAIKSSTLYAFTITPENTGTTINMVAPEGSKVTLLSSSVAADGLTHVVEYTLAATGTNTNVTFSDALSYGAEKTSAVAATMTYDMKRFVSGTVGVNVTGVTGIVQSGVIVSFDFIKTEGETDTVLKTVTATSDSEGKFKIWYGADVEGQNKFKLYATVNGEEIVKNFTAIPTSAQALTFGTTTGFTYYPVSGLISSALGAVVGVDVTVAGENTFGLTDGKVKTTAATANVNYKFAVLAGTELTITPEGTGIYDVASIQVKADAAVTAVNFTMATKTYAVTVYDYDDKEYADAAVKYRYTDGAYSDAAYDDEAKKYKFTLNAIIATSSVYWYATSAARTFTPTADSPLAYDSTKSVKVDDKQYTVLFVDAQGNKIDLSGLTDAKLPALAKYTAYTVPGGEIYTDKAAAPFTLDTSKKADGKFTFIGVMKAQSVTSTPSDVIVISAPIDSGYEFAKDIYLLSTETTLTITAYGDKLEGTIYEYKSTDLLKNVNATITVTLKNGDTTIGTAKMGTDGKFAIYSAEEIKSTFKVSITDSSASYTFADATVASDGKYYSKERTMVFSFQDNDSAKIAGAELNMTAFKVNGTDIIEDGQFDALKTKFTVKNAFAKDDKILPTIANHGYSDYKITEAEIAAGAATLKSDVATYTVTLQDASGAEGIEDADITAVYYAGTTSVTVVPFVKSEDDGVYKLLMTVPGKANMKDYTAVGAIAEAVNFTFPEDATLFSGAAVTIKAEESLTTVKFVDAAGEAITFLLAPEVTVLVNDMEEGIVFVTETGFKYYYNSAYTYEFTVTDSEPYTFGKTVSGGKLAANEETVYIVVANQTGKPIYDAEAFAIMSDETLVEMDYDEEDEAYEAIVIKDEIDAFMVNGDIYLATSAFITIPGYSFTGIAAGGGIPDEIWVIAELNDGTEFKFQLEEGVIYNLEINEIDSIYGMIESISIVAYADDDIYTADLDLDTYVQNLKLVIIGEGFVFVKAEPIDMFADLYDVLDNNDGTVTLSAVNEYVVPIEGKLTSKADLKFTFAGWYVNGVKVSDELNTVYTLKEDSAIYAAYTESVYDEKIPEIKQEEGIDSTVLILGIVAVIIALLAVAYAAIAGSRKTKVEQKKE